MIDFHYRIWKIRTAAGLAAALLLGLSTATAVAQIDPALLAGLEARSIGPAGMSGRIAAIDAVVANPDIIFVGAATGGVWKSENSGLTWEPLFDDEAVASIGAVAIFQPNPDIVWVGTGEGNPRNSTSVGAGIYKSLDGGDSWTLMGLEKSERIHRIVVHPSDPDTVYVGAMGQAWGENEERGVFKTTDGGKTWQKVLYVDARTGIADLVMDPDNPNKLIAAMWDYRRWPWSFRSGGPGSGIFISHDAGASWKRMTEDDGLPKGDLGRIGIAISRSDPEIVYALIEAEESGLARSDDGGKSWRMVNDDPNVAMRPFYFNDIRVDPERPDRVYKLQQTGMVSDDGGRTFRTLVPFALIHPDHHAMWINPNDAEHIIDGNDGGVGISRDRGKTWRFAANLPLAQYYHIAVDDDLPYHVYGGMQDNGSWRGPSEVWENGGIRNHHWLEVAFGDGFDTQPEPGNSSIVYGMSQQGFLVRWNAHTGVRKSIRPAPPGDGTDIRFNWNAGFAIDPFDPATLYFGSQFVHKSTDRGDSWTIISADLTTNDPEHQKQAESGGLTLDVTGAENFTTIVTIAPSAVESGVIWVGTDDGRVHVSRDGGAVWQSVEGRARRVPDGTWVPHIEPSPHDAATAFVVFDDHRRSNWTPYVFRVEDYGRRWVNIATDDIKGYALVIEQDPVNPDLLFLGTEFGLYVSLNGGGSWFKWRHGVPTVSVMDIALQRRESDLVLGTHGRAAFVIDDISPLRTLRQADFELPLKLLPIGLAQQYRVRQTGASRFPGSGEFRGENEPYGAMITWVMSGEDIPHPDREVERERQIAKRAARPATPVAADPDPDKDKKKNGKEDKGPEVTIEVRDSSGALIRTFEAPARLGLNRAVWDLRRDDWKKFADAEKDDDAQKGPEVPPGVYQVTLGFGDSEAIGLVTVVADPRLGIAAADRQANYETGMRVTNLWNLLVEAGNRILTSHGDIGHIVAMAKGGQEAAGKSGNDGDNDDALAALIDRAGEVEQALTALERRLRSTPDEKGIRDRMSYSSGKIGQAAFLLRSSWQRPTEAQLTYVKLAEQHLSATLDDLNAFFDQDIAEFRALADGLDLRLLKSEPPLSVPAE